MRKILMLVICFALLGSANSQSHEELISSMSGALGRPINTTTVGAANRLSVWGEEYSSLAGGTYSGYTPMEYNTKVVLRYDDNLFKKMDKYVDWYLTVEYDLFTYDENGDMTVHGAQQLKINYVAGAGSDYVDEQVKSYQHAVKADLFVKKIILCGTPACTTSFTILPPYMDDVYLDLVQQSKACYTLAYTPRVDFSITAQSNELGIAWDHAEGASSYDVEWLFIDVPESPSTTDVEYDFYNATRINTTNNYYHVPLAYPSGIILFRVRSRVVTNCGESDEQLGYSMWSNYTTGTGNTSTTSTTGAARFDFDGLDPEMNWSYTTSYAEEGKYKNAISYFDGLMRNRQNISTINSLQDVMIAETMYDHIGRPVVQTMPVPFQSNNNNGIYYHNNFNTDFYADNFDLDTLMNKPWPLDTTAWAAKYYSANSQYRTSDPYLPQANGYAYTQVRYKNDGTERVNTQAGVGMSHMMGSGHEVKTFYGTATGRELDELFGNEVSVPTRYQKILTQDPQGQVSVTYLDQLGRTIANGLTGAAGSGLLPIDVPGSTPVETADLLYGNASNITGHTASYTKTIVTPGGDFSFSYKLDTADFDHPCFPLKHCIYDVSISISDQYGDLVPVTVGTKKCNNGTSPCPSPYYELVSGKEIKFTAVSDCEVSFNTTLDLGSYTITKTVTLNSDSAASYSQHFFDSYINEMPTEGCYIYPEVEPASCEGDCEVLCNMVYKWNAVNSEEDSIYVAEDGTIITDIEELEDLREACIVNCGSITPATIPNDCAMKLKLMKQDMSPGGQYFDDLVYGFSYAGPGHASGTPDDDWMLSNVHAEGGSTNDEWFEDTFGEDIFTWEDVKNNWDTSFVSAVFDSPVTIGGLPRNNLLECHPEWCIYLLECVARPCDGDPNYANIMPASNTFDNILMTPGIFMPSGNTLADYMNPVTITYNNTVSGSSTTNGDITYWPYNIDEEDPYFNADGCEVLVCGNVSDVDFMRNELTSYLGLGYADPDYYFSIWYVINDPDSLHNSTTPVGNISAAAMQVFYVLHGNPITGDPGIIPKNAAGRQEFFADAYLGLKSYVQYLVEQQTGCSRLEPDPGFVGENRTTGGYKIRFPKNDLYAEVNCETYGDTFETGSPATYEPDPETLTLCENECEASVSYWIQQVEATCGVLTTEQQELIEEYLILVCKASCQNESTQQGSSSCGDCDEVIYEDESEVEHTFTSFTQVIEYFTGEFIESTPCEITICHPAALTENTACLCEEFASYLAEHPAANTNALIAAQVYTDFGIVVSEDQVAAWQNECNSVTCPSKLVLTSNEFPQAFIDSATVASAGAACICENIYNYFEFFGYTDIHDATQRENFVADLQEETGDTGFDIDDLGKWLSECNSACKRREILLARDLPEALDCHDVIADPLAACNEQATIIANNLEAQIWYDTISKARDRFEVQYAGYCLTNVDSREQFEMEYPVYESMITLYYYDQAGNLVKTVPPKGVQKLSSGDMAAVDSYRSNPVLNAADYTVPAHDYVSQYKFNSYQSVTWQNTPDGNASNFYYDEKGRIKASQSARQANYSSTDPGYSYTVYDDLGRPVETGEALSGTPLDEDITRYAISMDFETWLGSAAKSEVTKTYYDAQDGSITNAFTGGTDRNLRNRIASSTYDEDGDGTYETAQHYRYDIHGNVAELYNENTMLADIGQDLKHMRYVYDLVSGNTHEMHYQEGEFDQLHHKYEYDADNRLQRAYSSTNGEIYRTEAKYFYYAHGLLKRVETGAHQVAGTDYAYTLQGWLKHMNAGALNTQHDMGHDSRMDQGNHHAAFTKDAHAYSLGYFKKYTASNASGIDDYDYLGGSLPDVEDYKNITAASNSPGLDFDESSSTFSYYVNSLFNGNIAYTTRDIMTGVSSNAPTYLDINLSVYRYDQAQRLKRSIYFTDGSARANNEIDDATAPDVGKDYQMFLEYDLNGNITKMGRYGNAGQMDSLTYDYVNYNQLEEVADAVGDGVYTTDVDGQSNHNYGYDQSGNLVSDVQENIIEISWNAMGKVRKIRREQEADLVDLEFKYNPLGQRIAKITKPRDGDGDLKNELAWTYTFYQLDATGNVIATYERTYSKAGKDPYKDHYKLGELYIYGADRVGSITPQAEYEFTFDATVPFSSDPDEDVYLEDRDYEEEIEPGDYVVNNYDEVDDYFEYIYVMGQRHYEQKSHLGDVVSTISDRRMAVDMYNYTTGTTHKASAVLGTCGTTIPVYLYVGTGGTKTTTSGTDDIADTWLAEVESYSDYYPFGMQMVGRNGVLSGGDYRYGFNGQEKDDEISGSGNSYTAEYWQMDPRLGRRWNIDPVVKPWQSGYSILGNNPILMVDPNGDSEWSSLAFYKEITGRDEFSPHDWSKEDRVNRTGSWATAMENITKDQAKGEFKAFEQIQAYYEWAGAKISSKGHESRWVKGALYLVNDLVDAYGYDEWLAPGYGVSSFEAIALIEDLNTAIADFAITKFNELLYGKYANAPLKGDAAYDFDYEFIKQEQGPVAYAVYSKYSKNHPAALKELDDAFNHRGLASMMGILGYGYIPVVPEFNINLTSPKTRFGEEGRIDIPMAMIWFDKHAKNCQIPVLTRGLSDPKTVVYSMFKFTNSSILGK